MADAQSRAALLQGAEPFDRGDWLAAHEAWESRWLRVGGSEASFFQGLIQLAVALHHAASGHPAAARKLLVRASQRLRPFEPARHGLDVTCLLHSLTELAASLGRDRQNPVSRPALPPFPLPLTRT